MIDSCAVEPQKLLTINDALAQIDGLTEPLFECENIPLTLALGRVLIGDAVAVVSLPGNNNAAMDGYAFSSQDIVAEKGFSLKCVGVSWAGRPFQGQLNPGECIRIFTGGIVPWQLDSVIMQEHVQADADHVHFPQQTQGKQNVRLAGEDFKQGSLVCTGPKKLTAADLGLLAAAGIANVQILRKLNITFFSTGDELTALEKPLLAGQIYDSNRYMLKGLLADPCHTVIDGGVIPDDKALLEVTLLKAAESSDMIITTGGASVGEADYVKEVLQGCGQVNFWKIAMKPGKPMAFGKIGACYLFGLPGNPLSAMATFRQFVQAALGKLAGLPTKQVLRLTATSTSQLKKAPGRQEFQCGILSQDTSGGFWVASAGQQGSHLLSTLHKANCYIVLSSDCQGVNPGEAVIVEPFDVHI